VARRARRRKGRPITGILLFDKPIGVSSNGALQDVKRLFQAAKAGHTGSLDPLASGLLPICFGEATKMSAFLLDANKTYQLSARIGLSTTTGDADGEISQDMTSSLPSRADVEAVLPKFIGGIEQIPPMYSALHHKGKRLYELAREGIEVEREPRPITIHALELVDWRETEDGLFADFTVHCSKGTYVRTLVEDIAKAVDNCAHVSALRRTGVGPFPSDQMVTAETLTKLLAEGPDAADHLLLPPDTAISHWPSVELNDEMSRYVRLGNPVLVPNAPDAPQIRLLNEKGVLIGVGELDEQGMVAPKRILKTG